jgi:hypothetical protein
MGMKQSHGFETSSRTWEKSGRTASFFGRFQDSHLCYLLKIAGAEK